MELWPWGMDRGQARIRMEISTSSDRLPSENSGVQQKEQLQMKGKNRNEQSRENHLPARQRGTQAVHDPNTESAGPQPEFKLVGRCELTEGTRVCFTRSKFHPRPPFASPPPPRASDCREEEFWSRGLLSLGAVTQLRVTVPFASAATALGLKALVVWGQPARCCPADEVERIKSIHQESERRRARPMFAAVKPPLQPETPQRFVDTICNLLHFESVVTKYLYFLSRLQQSVHPRGVPGPHNAGGDDAAHAAAQRRVCGQQDAGGAPEEGGHLGPGPQRPLHRRPLHLHLPASAQPPSEEPHRPLPAAHWDDPEGWHAGEEREEGRRSADFKTSSLDGRGRVPELNKLLHHSV